MTEEGRSRGNVAAGGERATSESIDWIAAERSPEFRELVSRRRRFVVPATVFFLTWYIGFILLAGYAEDFMGESIYEGLTVGYVLALTQFVMVWVLGWLYLRQADRVFDPLAERAAKVALEAGVDHTEAGGAKRAPEPPREEVRPG
jgi:uncharacterized membrane protein (DUF485 family)